MKEDANIAVLILAAGKSSRMGQPKQLLPWGKTTLLNNAIGQAKKVTQHVFVVLGANRDMIEASMPSDVVIVFNPDWQQGMGTSISMGISELQKRSNFKAVLIMLSDQPLLDSQYLEELKRLYITSKSKITATSYGDKNGVPAVFHYSLFNDLRKLNKDYGAKMMMKKYESQLISLSPNGNEIDIDTPEIYTQLRAKSK